MRFRSKSFAFSNSTLRLALTPRPARFTKYVSIRIPELGPFGETLFEARALAMLAASFVKRPSGGCVESVFTFATQRLGRRAFRFDCLVVILPPSLSVMFEILDSFLVLLRRPF